MCSAWLTAFPGRTTSCATTTPMDNEASVAAFALSSCQPATQTGTKAAKSSHWDDCASSTSETYSSGSVDRLHLPFQQPDRICTIPQQKGSISIVVSLIAGDLSENDLDNVSVRTMEPTSDMHEDVDLVSAAIGNGDFEAPGSMSTETRSGNHAAMTKHFSEASQRGAHPQIYEGREGQFFASSEQHAGYPCLKSTGHGSSAHSEASDSERYLRNGECNECVPSADQRHVMGIMQTRIGNDVDVCKESGRSRARKRNNSQPMLTGSSEKPPACSECGQRFSRQSSLRTHTLTHTRETPHVCDKCGQKFSQKSNMMAHMLTHTGEKPHICSECEQRFLQKSTMTTHMLTHTGEKPHACSKCGQRFSQRCNLTTHMLTHTGEKPHTCNECGQRFSQRSNLTTHMVTHTGEKPHVCDECGQRFSRRSSIRKHMLTHTGEKPHACNECGQKFSQKSNLMRHILTHTGEKPHSCSECGQRFPDKRNVIRHMLIHARETPHR